jgi:hypothetical protein
MFLWILQHFRQCQLLTNIYHRYLATCAPHPTMEWKDPAVAYRHTGSISFRAIAYIGFPSGCVWRNFPYLQQFGHNWSTKSTLIVCGNFGVLSSNYAYKRKVFRWGYLFYRNAESHDMLLTIVFLCFVADCLHGLGRWTDSVLERQNSFKTVREILFKLCCFIHSFTPKPSSR